MVQWKMLLKLIRKENAEMKKINICILMLFIALSAKAQIPSIVNDPLNYAQLGLMIEEGISQTEELRKTWDILDKTKKAVDMVNKEVKRYQDIDRVLTVSQNIARTADRLIDRYKQFDGSGKDNLLQNVKMCIVYKQQLLRNMDILTQLLTNNTFKMNDYERMRLMNEQLREMNNLASALQRRDRAMQRIERKKQLFKNF